MMQSREQKVQRARRNGLGSRCYYFEGVEKQRLDYSYIITPLHNTRKNFRGPGRAISRQILYPPGQVRTQTSRMCPLLREIRAR
jgi:hypothetical protein